MTVAGVVTGRQAPGTAAGVTFFTLEDDTGNINTVVWQNTARAQKSAYISAKNPNGKKKYCRLKENVVHVIAKRKLIDITEHLTLLQSRSKIFIKLILINTVRQCFKDTKSAECSALFTLIKLLEDVLEPPAPTSLSGWNLRWSVTTNFLNHRFVKAATQRGVQSNK